MIKKEVKFTHFCQIFKLVKKIKAHDTCEIRWATGSTLNIIAKIQANTQVEYSHINNFARHVQQRLQPNGGHLEHVL